MVWKMQGLHGVENKILLVSYNIKLTKVTMTLSVPSFQNAINLGQNSIIATIFPAKKNREPPQFIAEHTMHVNFIFVDINLGLQGHKMKQNVTFVLTTTTHRQ